MEFTQYNDALALAFSQNCPEVKLDTKQAEKFYLLSKMLVKMNKEFNLTAITDENEIILKHFVDCACISPFIPEGSRLIDVGCGAGFPSLPIAILREDVNVTSLDSTSKKIAFISSVEKELALRNINAVSARAEEFAILNREKYDVCTSRAVARLNVLDELCLPLVKQGGIFIAMKSSKGEEEYSEASKGIKALGAELSERSSLKLKHDGLEIEREIFVFKKIKEMPLQYPRKYAQILKRPI